MGRFLALALVVSAVLAGCVASDDGSRGPTIVAGETSDRRVGAAVDEATPTTVAAPAPTVATAKASVTSPRPRVSRAVSSPAVARTTPQSGSPWSHYSGQLTGGTYVVAHANGPGVNVSPSPDAAPAATLSNPLPSGAPRVLLVVQDGGEWLQVLLPVRPNSSVGWVRKSDVSLSTVHYRVEIDRAAHRVRVFDGSENIVFDEPAAMGKPSTPTPSGQFFSIELLQPTNPSGAYGPYAFTLSAYSDVYQTFGSGDGAVGLHGTNEPSSIGNDASHGCVRLRNDAVTRLAGMLPLGTPVFIR